MMERFSKAMLMKNKDEALYQKLGNWDTTESEGFSKPKRLIRKKKSIILLLPE